MSVPRETDRLARLAALVRYENRRQNLVSAATLADMEERHIADSAQLVPLLPPGRVVDIGSGAGFPGLVIACLHADPIDLVEPRARRAAFLTAAAATLDLPHVTVHPTRVERLELAGVSAITARAVASLDAMFAIAAHLATPTTRWILPKGRRAAAELEAAATSWQGDFTLVPSRTDPSASIVVATGVRRRPLP